MSPTFEFGGGVQNVGFGTSVMAGGFVNEEDAHGGVTVWKRKDGPGQKAIA